MEESIDRIVDIPDSVLWVVCFDRADLSLEPNDFGWATDESCIFSNAFKFLFVRRVHFKGPPELSVTDV
jgi:hypothetical protein